MNLSLVARGDAFIADRLLFDNGVLVTDRADGILVDTTIEYKNKIVKICF